MSLKISSRYSPLALQNTVKSSEFTTSITDFLLKINVVRRLSATNFFKTRLKEKLNSSWIALDDVQSFHSKRWLIQLNLFNILYICTLAFGIYQIKKGILQIGFLVLIKWSFDQLWQILVYIIEYYVNIIEQIQDTKLIRDELGSLEINNDSTKRVTVFPEEPSLKPDWKEITLKNILVQFPKKDDSESLTSIRIPELVIKKGKKIAIIGESGSGKSTLLNVLLNLVEYTGEFYIDDKNLQGRSLNSSFITVINSFDPLFRLSIGDNILLGRSATDERLTKILSGIKITDWVGDLNNLVGSQNFYLSSGQEQRIRIARGLIEKSDIYLLDETFNGLDTDTKNDIISFMTEELSNSTIIFVTHNKLELSWIDEVYTFKDGILALQ